MAAPCYLVIDQGGSSTRALVLGGDGSVLGEGRVDIATRRPRPGWVEHDPQELERSLRIAINGACQAAGGPELTAAGLATQRSTVVCWERGSARPLSPALSWQDRRNAALIERMAGAAGRVRELTGLPLSPHYGASKLAWCLQQLPRLAEASRRGELVCGPLASFLLHALLSERPLLTDPANAARTLLWDLGRRDWSDELLGLFGIDRNLLPDCVATEHGFGSINVGGRHVPLQICTGDQSAVPFAAGPPDPQSCYVNIGTGAFIQRPTGAGRPEAGDLLAGILHCAGECVTYVLEGTVNGAGSALATCAAIPADDDGPAVDVPLFLNGVSGLGSPYWRAQFASRFIGRAGPSARRRAVLESIVFLIEVNRRRIAEHSGPVARLIASGGLAADDELCRLLANLSRLPVLRPSAVEATALGVGALLAGLPAGWRPALEAQRFEPWPDAALAGRFERWGEAMAEALAS